MNGRTILVVFALATGALQAQTRDCPALDIALDEAMTAALEASDCQVREIIGSGTNQALAKRFRLNVTERTVFTFALNSSEFDTFLYLYSAQFRLLASHASRFVIHLPPGSYTILAAGAAPQLTGAFQFKASPETPRLCPTTDLALDSPAAEAFSSGSCRILDLSPLSTSENFITFYRVAMARPGVLTVASETAVPRFSTVLSTPDLVAFRGDLKIVAGLPRGTMLVSVSAALSGSYTIKATVEDFRVCTDAPVESPGEVNATLDSNGCRLLDVFQPSDDTSAIKPHSFRFGGRTVAELDQSSRAFDSALWLFDDVGRALAYNNNFRAGSPDSRIVIHLPPGTYIAGASANGGGQTGAYTLRIGGDAPRECTFADITADEPATGVLSSSDSCRVLDLVPYSTSLQAATPLKLDVPHAAMMTLTARLQPASGTLSMVTESGIEAFRRQAFTDGSISVQMRVAPGAHRMVFSSTAAARPNYNLRVALEALPNCPTTAVNPTDSVSATLSSLDCRAIELVPYLTAIGRGKPYTLRVPGGGRQTITAESTSFPPFLIVTAADGRLVGINVANSPGTVDLVGNLPAGEYQVTVGSVSTTNGSFRMQTRLEGGAASSSLPMPKLHVDKLFGAPPPQLY